MSALEGLTATSNPISFSSVIFARLAFLSTLTGLVLFIALHVLKRELDPAWRMVSEYAVGRHGWAMTLCFLALSLSCVCSLLAIFPFVHTIGGKIGLVLLFCAAVGLAAAATFPTDPITVGPGDASPAARLHGLSVIIGVPTLTIAALLLSDALARTQSWTPVRLPLLGFAYLIWIGLALTIAVVAIGLPKNGGFGPAVQVGWPNRLTFIAYFGWLGSLSWPLMNA